MAEGARKPASTGGIAGERLKSFVERIERLEEEKTALSGDIKEVYSEAKSVGFRYQDHAPADPPASHG
jgi:uncharacterized protein (UPF0335 family)